MVRDTERAERMAEMYRSGVTLAEIGAAFGITRERVRQILNHSTLDAEARRKIRYPHGVRETRACEYCGTTFTAPRSRIKRYCKVECSRRASHTPKTWNEERMVYAMQRFYVEHGRVPYVREMMFESVALKIPSITTLTRHYGSMVAAFKAAGLEPRKTGRPKKVVEV